MLQSWPAFLDIKNDFFFADTVREKQTPKGVTLDQVYFFNFNDGAVLLKLIYYNLNYDTKLKKIINTILYATDTSVAVANGSCGLKCMDGSPCGGNGSYTVWKATPAPTDLLVLAPLTSTWFLLGSVSYLTLFYNCSFNNFIL